MRSNLCARTGTRNKIDRRQALAALLGASSLPLLSGCTELLEELPEPTPRLVEVPGAGIPRSLREWNWGGGSCVFASWVHTERQLSFHDIAAYIRKTYAGGESYNGLTSKMRKLGVPFYSCIEGRSDNDVARRIFTGIYLVDWLERQGRSWYGTFAGDPDVLERATAERRMAIIFYKPNHSINHCGYEGSKAYLLDNNAIEQYETVDKETFVRNWRNRYGGVAVVPNHGEPPCPIPYLA